MYASKHWKLHSLNYFLKKIHTTGDTRRSQMDGKSHKFQDVFQPEHAYHDLQNLRKVIDAAG